MYHALEITIRTHVQNTSLHFGVGRKFYLSSKQEHYLVGLIEAPKLMGVRIKKVVLKKVVGEFIGYALSGLRFNRKCAFFNVITIRIFAL